MSGYKGNTHLKAIKTRIRQLYSGIYEKLDVVDTRTIAEVARIAYFDPASCFKDGKLLSIPDMPEYSRKCVRELDEVTTTDKNGNQTTKVKLKFNSKLDALELLAKTQGLLDSRGQNADGPTTGQQPVVFNMIFGDAGKVEVSKQADEAKAEDDDEIIVEGEWIG
jgi:hypothetical protein